jgi:sarcosine oxidase subunit alpha
VPTRLFRMSFTGEAGYEINVPADYGDGLGRALSAAEPMGMCLYGTETMHVLRAEKGYIIVGQDTDGTVTPHDAGPPGRSARRRPTLSAFAAETPGSRREGRKQLVGLP